MLRIDLTDLRLYLHLVAAVIWVGGQLVLAVLVPALRAVSAEAAPAAGRRFARVAWPAFAVLLLTGMWNLAVVGPGVTGAYRTTLVLKLAAVVVSGAAAYGHERARSARSRAWTGALTGLAALSALFLGTVLHG